MYEGDIVRHDFPFRNDGDDTLIITNVRASCGCTMSGALPNEVGPGETGAIFAQFNSSGKRGRITKSIFVTTNAEDSAELILTLEINVLPETARPSVAETTVIKSVDTSVTAVRVMTWVDRSRSRSIFDTACATCHVAPAREQYDVALYDVACAMCHGNATHPAIDSAAAMTGSRYLTSRSNAALRDIISRGTTNPMMPGFAVDHGGPLTDSQIVSLVTYFDRIRPHVPIHILPKFSEIFSNGAD